MILSMTGYGKEEIKIGDRSYRIEVRSLNSKGFEFRARISDDLKEKELEIRKIVQKIAIRGKIDLYITGETPYGGEEYELDEELLTHYSRQLSQLSNQLNLSGDILQAVMKIPNVIKPSVIHFTEDHWEDLETALKSALSIHRTYRITEGEAMEKAMKAYTTKIMDGIEQIKNLDTDRIEKIRKKFQSNFEHISREVESDQNRLEQELIFYLEKMDFTEEMVRLSQHCKYLLEVLDAKQESKGRKLNFITQEMGREINTLGSKAYDSNIQRLVVEMKDELEKIKEQTANIL